jgi:hypothetical protein
MTPIRSHIPCCWTPNGYGTTPRIEFAIKGYVHYDRDRSACMGEDCQVEDTDIEFTRFVKSTGTEEFEEPLTEQGRKDALGFILFWREHDEDLKETILSACLEEWRGRQEQTYFDSERRAG